MRSWIFHYGVERAGTSLSSFPYKNAYCKNGKNKMGATKILDPAELSDCFCVLNSYR